MKLTKLQKKTLQFLDSCQVNSPTIGRQLHINWFAWLPLLMIAMLGCVVLLTPGFQNMGWLWIGLVAGAFFRDIGRFRAQARVWPVYREIINWPRVKELLEAQAKTEV